VSRVDELTVRLLDGEATAEEVAELERLVAEDAGARRAALRLHQVEAALRGERRGIDVAAAVMEQIGRARSERVVRGVMKQVAAAQPPWRQAAGAAPGSRRRRWLWPAAAAAVVLLGGAASAALLLLRPRAPHPAGESARGAGDIHRGGERASLPPPALLPGSAATAGAGARESVVLFSFDFEDGELPADFIDGHVVASPCPAGSRQCLQGTISPYLGRVHTVTVERVNPPLLVYAPGQVLSFDYWVGGDARKIIVQGWSKVRRQNYGAELGDLVREGWGRAELPVSELVGYRDGERLQPGQPVSNIVIKAGKVGGKPFYVDNLRLVQVLR
jgi:hypothetical protein